jgi:hypothetical protein
MTFVEAAIEILKREGKPLSSRRLAELAVKLNLLSVVGRDPESTMQERLEDALENIARHPDLVRLKPDTFGLHDYPPQPYPANGTQAHAVPAEGGAEAGEPKKGRRRRGRGGRAPDAVEGAAAAPAPAEAAADGEDEAAEGEEGDAPATGSAAAGEAGEAGAPADAKRRRRRRGGRGRRRRGEGGEAAEAKNPGASFASAVRADAEHDEDGEDGEDGEDSRPPSVSKELPSEASSAGTPDAGDEPADAASDDAELLDESAGDSAGGGDDDEELEEGEIDEHTGPLLAPAFGAEDVTRTDDDRTVRPEIRGSRDDRRHRHKGGGRDRHRERGGKDRAAATGGERKPQPPAPEHKERTHEPRAHAAHEPRAHAAAHEPRAHAAHEPRTGDLLETLLDLLRGSDGRPMHVRHLVETAVKKRVLDEKAHPADLVRLARAALVREQRESEADGLRPRIRALGGGNYGTVDRKLDPELLQAERDLGDRAFRLRDATRTAVRRRLGRMAPAAFDALGRTLTDKLGITGLELLRRGEGVTYWGGTRPRGVATTRVLVAFRPGEGEVNRRAVGELRAGLAAKGYDEGLLFAGGRPNAEALTELKQGGVTLYDGLALAALLVRHGLGVKRVSMPIDYLDLDFFFELQES